MKWEVCRLLKGGVKRMPHQGNMNFKEVWCWNSLFSVASNFRTNNSKYSYRQTYKKKSSLTDRQTDRSTYPLNTSLKNLLLTSRILYDYREFVSFQPPTNLTSTSEQNRQPAWISLPFINNNSPSREFFFNLSTVCGHCFESNWPW